MIVCVYFCKIFWPRPLVIFRSKYFLTLICWMSPLCVTDIRVKLIIKHSRLQSPCFFFSLKHKRMRVGVTVWGVYVWSYQVLSYVDRTSHYCHLTHKEESITQSNCIFIFFVPACPQTETPACAEKELDFGSKFTMEIPPPLTHTAHHCCGAVGLLLWCGMSRHRDNWLLCSPALPQSDTGPPAFHTDLSDCYSKGRD